MRMRRMWYHLLAIQNSFMPSYRPPWVQLQDKVNLSSEMHLCMLVPDDQLTMKWMRLIDNHTGVFHLLLFQRAFFYLSKIVSFLIYCQLNRGQSNIQTIGVAGPQGDSGVRDSSNHTQRDDPHSNNEFNQPNGDFGHSNGTNSGHDRDEHHSDLNNQSAQHRGNPSMANLDLDKMACIATLPKHVCNLYFIHALRNATHDDGIGLTGNAPHCLHNPPWQALQPDLDTKLALLVFFALKHSSEQTYKTIRQGIHDHHLDTLIPSFYHTKQLLADLNGVTSIVDHKCINSCVAFIGPFSELEHCSDCNEPCYDQTKLSNSVGSIKDNTIPFAHSFRCLSTPRQHAKDAISPTMHSSSFQRSSGKQWLCQNLRWCTMWCCISRCCLWPENSTG